MQKGKLELHKEEVSAQKYQHQVQVLLSYTHFLPWQQSSQWWPDAEEDQHTPHDADQVDGQFPAIILQMKTTQHTATVETCVDI